MKMRVRAAILSLVLVLVVGGVAGAVPAQIFSDVPPSHMFYDFIEDFSRLKITVGCGGGRFCPNNLTTRGEMAVFLVRFWKRVTTGSTTGPYFSSPPMIRNASNGVRTARNGDNILAFTSTGKRSFSFNGSGSDLYLGERGPGASLRIYDGAGKSQIRLYSTGQAYFKDASITYEDDSGNSLYKFRNGEHYGNYVGATGDYVLNSRDDILFTIDDYDSSSAFGEFCITDGAGDRLSCTYENGNTWAKGTKSALVDTESYGKRYLYAVESTGNWFEDFGSAQLVDGAVQVTIDAIYAETVNLNDEYHVLATPQCEQPAVLYVSAKTPTGFTVQGRDLDNAASNCAFSYRISAKRLGYEEVRLAPFEEQDDGDVQAAQVVQEAEMLEPMDEPIQEQFNDETGWLNTDATE